MEKIGLILEGGGMRGMFTTGVIDYFIEVGIEFPVVVGVSAGACHGMNYISKQKYRSRDIVLDFIHDPRYCGLKNLLTTGSLFGTDFAYYQIPVKYNLFDYQGFVDSKSEFYNVMSHLESGEASYPLLTDMRKDMEYLHASSSLPFISKKVEIDQNYYLDGGVSDAIPLRFSESIGCRKNVVILTRPKGYRKSEKSKSSLIVRAYYGKYPKFVAMIESRNKRYNEALDYVEQEEKKGIVLVLRPDDSLKLKRIEKDITKLNAAYQMGYDYAKAEVNQIIKFMNE